METTYKTNIKNSTKILSNKKQLTNIYRIVQINVLFNLNII